MSNDDLALAFGEAHPGDHLTEPAHRAPVALAHRDGSASVAAQPRLEATLMRPNEAAGLLLLSPGNWTLLKEQCTELVQGHALHSSIGTPARAAMIAMKAIEMGIPITSAFSGFRFIDGELCMLGKLLLRLIQQRAIPKGAVCEPIPVPFEEQKLRAGWLMGRAGHKPQEYWFTIEMARDAGLLEFYSRKANDGRGGIVKSVTWERYPQRMLRWRGLAEGANYEFQDIMQGCLLAEEMSHKDPEFIEADLAAQAKAKPESKAPSFAEGAPERIELARDHEALVQLSDLMSEFVTLASQLAGLRGDAVDDQWYDRTYQEKRKALCQRCVRGKFPTEGEANTMKSILHDELRALKEQLANATVAPPSAPPSEPPSASKSKGSKASKGGAS